MYTSMVGLLKYSQLRELLMNSRRRIVVSRPGGWYQSTPPLGKGRLQDGVLIIRTNS
jgi:hypothetical protein